MTARYVGVKKVLDGGELDWPPPVPWVIMAYAEPCSGGVVARAM